MTIILKAINVFSVIPTRILAVIFAEIDKLTIKFILGYKGPCVAKNNLVGAGRVGEFTYPDFNTYCKAIVINSNNNNMLLA